MESINGMEYIYFVHWFAYISVFVFLIVVVEVAVIQNYVTLCFEEYRWWWRVYLGSASTGFWLFILMISYLFADTTIDSTLTILTYFVSAGLVCSLIGLMAASVAMIFTLMFNKSIYGLVK